jgi:hypothetical protein
LEFFFLLGIALGAAAVVSLATFAVAWLVGGRLCTPSAKRHTLLLVCWFIALSPLLSGVGMAGTVGEPVLYTGPLALLVGIVGGTLLSRRYVTATWPRGVLHGLTAMVGHLVIGWPMIFLPFWLTNPLHDDLWADQRHTYRATRRARVLLADYGLALPVGYAAVDFREHKGHTDNTDRARIYLAEQHVAIDYNAYYDLYQTEGQGLPQWVERAGYRPTSRAFGLDRFYLKEPRAILLGGSRRQFWIYPEDGRGNPRSAQAFLVELHLEHREQLAGFFNEWGHPELRWTPADAAAAREAAKLKVPRIQPGTVAPEFIYRSPAGELHRFSALKGKPVILNFWAEGAPPCQELHTWLWNHVPAEAEVEIVCVIPPRRMAHTEYGPGPGNWWRFGASPQAFERYGITGWPTTVYVAADGTADEVVEGIDFARHQQALDKLLH